MSQVEDRGIVAPDEGRDGITVAKDGDVVLLHSPISRKWRTGVHVAMLSVGALKSEDTRAKCMFLTL
ncbi:MAG: hypothetical protein QM749_05710 [Aquabacterium sp.]